MRNRNSMNSRGPLYNLKATFKFSVDPSWNMAVTAMSVMHYLKITRMLKILKKQCSSSY
ncbi:unnamed protein product [Acanthoscelides obtectus]|uniref:Uncharacterized protein n=1 Tax=Acanthoscelides obtectus TaxID=200917 RepID=A0A9P0JRR7_ACAOB|nr:unnamed protein product [Acanthoscelides obtectus]CAK1668208.1 hypothetical protein AOBTE_LOCUS26281 [Acanthoscelides obtectus]